MKKIFLALTGSIACIKSFDLIKVFQEKGYEVQIILTKGGEEFSSRLSLESMTGFPILGPEIFSFPKTEEYTNPFQKNTSEIFAHLELSQDSEALVIAPCSASFLSKIVQGEAEDFLSTALLAYTKPIFLAPAMNTRMWENNQVKENISYLSHISSSGNFHIISPQNSGVLACREEGAGKMAEVQNILASVERILFQKKKSSHSTKKNISGKNILITTGGTQEKLDPVRYLGNFSTGKTGKIIAEKCFEMGAKKISVVQGNVSSEISPFVAKIQKIQSGEEMKIEIEKNFSQADIIIFAAAVSDMIPEKFSETKIKKEQFFQEKTENISSISLKKNIDIAEYFAQKKLPHQIFIGFALETGDEEFLKKSLQKKAHSKKFDIVLGNTPENFGTDSGKYLVYFAKKNIFQEFSGKKEAIFEEIFSGL